MRNKRALWQLGTACTAAAIVVLVGLTLTAAPQIGTGEASFDQLLREHLGPTALRIASGIGMVLEPAGGIVLLLAIGAVVWWRADRLGLMHG